VRLYSEILQLIHQAYGDDAVRRAAVCKWWKRFRDGETNVKGQNRLFHYPPEACGKQSAARFREVGGERFKKCIACQGKYFEKETVTAPPQSSDSE
jgi:hypothetical protein